MGGVKSAKKRKSDKDPSSRVKTLLNYVLNDFRQLQNVRGRRNPKNQPRREKIIGVPEQFREIEQQDEEFFEGDEFGDYSFLKNLDASEIGKRIQKEKQPSEERTKNPSKILPSIEESHDEYSNEEDLGDIVGDALDINGSQKHKWEQEQPYERQPRKGDSQWRRKDSTRLPVRTVTGKLMELEASGSDSESSEESEESDADSESVAVAEEPVAEIVKVGKEAVIEAKEALAKLAGEILEEPQERVCSAFRHTNIFKISNLKTLREVFNKGNLTIQKLALLTQLTVYKDIIPGYI